MEKQRFHLDPLLTVRYCTTFLSFVPGHTMPRNVAYNLQYLDFMHQLTTNYGANGSLERSLIKNQIVVLGSILECFVYSLLERHKVYIDFGNDWQEVGPTKKYINIDTKRRVKTVLQEEVPGELRRRSDLSWMIDIAEKNNIFGKQYASTAHFVREYRNKIHLTTMTELEYEYFTEAKLNEAKKCVYKFLVELSGKTANEIKATFPFLI